MTFGIVHALNYISLRCCGTLTSSVRVRFAPSPTGFLHLGGLRTAFFNYLFARKNNGKFILRIEDTDQKRIVPGSVENLSAMLKWSGLEPDESPFCGGPFGPYVQSQRLDIYQERVLYLLETGAAYRCFCSEARLDILKKEAVRQRVNWGYDNKCRHLEREEEERFLREGKPYTVRFKIPKGAITYDDIVFGRQTYDVSENEGDFILMKSDGFPTYHLACVVDDQCMRISHVLRGSEWLASTPKHLLLHRALKTPPPSFAHLPLLTNSGESDGFPTYHLAGVVDDDIMRISHVLRGSEWLASTPKHLLLHRALGTQPPSFAHLPLLTNSDRSKLSKRQESIGIENFKERGYSSEALLNFLAASGGGFGKQEGCFIYDLNTLASKFHLENLNMGSCIVDFKKLDLFNHNYLVQQLENEKSIPHLIKDLRAILKKKYGSMYDKEETNLHDSYIKKILLCYKDRVNTLHDLVAPDLEYLWTALEWEDISQKFSSLKIQDSAIASLKAVSCMLGSIPESEFTEGKLNTKLKEICKELKVKYSALMRALRVVLTGQKDGPSVAEVLEMLGQKRSLEKINFVTKKISEKRKIDICNT